MEQTRSKQDIISKLRKDMLLWEGFKPPIADKDSVIGLGLIETAFPNKTFPTGTIHEFITGSPEQAAASDGFISGLLNSLMTEGGVCLWIGTSRLVFPPSLKAFGLNPDRVIFIDLNRDRDILWVMEEALKCEDITAVVAEVKQINFIESRRLQLATEKSGVTGLVIRTDPDKITSTTCTARWRVTPLPSNLEDELPGISYPRWCVELLKVRNGNTATYTVEWRKGFVLLPQQVNIPVVAHLKVG